MRVVSNVFNLKANQHVKIDAPFPKKGTVQNESNHFNTATEIDHTVNNCVFFNKCPTPFLSMNFEPKPLDNSRALVAIETETCSLADKPWSYCSLPYEEIIAAGVITLAVICTVYRSYVGKNENVEPKRTINAEVINKPKI